MSPNRPVSCSPSRVVHLRSRPAVLAVAAASLVLAACGQGPASGEGGAKDDAASAAQLAERERALAEREAAVTAREREEAEKLKAAAEAAARAKAEAEAAAKAEAERTEAAAAAAAKARAERDKAEAQKRLAAERAAAEKKAQRERAEADRRSEEAKARAAAARPIEVPAGTRLAIALKQGLSSKTANPGDRFEAVLTEDVKGADGRIAVPAGATVTGTVTNVVSGSRQIGATPAIGLRFENLVTADGKRIPISGELDEQGKSERGRDTAKILGGVAAGAIIGNQAKRNDSGRVIGGILGGAIGAIAAKNTGTEVALGDGAALTIALGAPITVTPGTH